MREKESHFILLVEAEGDDIVLRDSNSPVALSPMRVRFRIIRRKDEPAWTAQISSTWSFAEAGIQTIRSIGNPPKLQQNSILIISAFIYFLCRAPMLRNV